MTIRILAVGKLKGGYYVEGCKDYQKRLSHYAKVDVVEVADEKAPESLSDAQRDGVRAKESQRLRDKLKPGRVVALCLEGEEPDSLAFAQRLARWEQEGVDTVQFLIGGSHGLSDEIIQQAHERLSLSALTLPHNLARLVLLEQLYRAMKINRNETYHK